MDAVKDDLRDANASDRPPRLAMESAYSLGPAPSATAAWPVTFDVIGLRVSAVNIPLALQQFRAWIANGARQYVCVADVHAVMQGEWNPDFRTIHNAAGMVTPDGMPLVWLGRKAFPKAAPQTAVARVYGPDLLMAACAQAESAEIPWRHFFYGGEDGVADTLVETLRQRFPALSVCGTLTPPFRALTPEEAEGTVGAINAARPDIVWVGLSTPKQERWMAAFRDRLDAPILIGIGAAFDFHSGRKQQAPLFFQRNGLEWAFRLATEPRRLWPRYRRTIPGFLAALLRQKLRGSRPRV